jgi:hypothetical protein
MKSKNALQWLEEQECSLLHSTPGRISSRFRSIKQSWSDGRSSGTVTPTSVTSEGTMSSRGQRSSYSSETGMSDSSSSHPEPSPALRPLPIVSEDKNAKFLGMGVRQRRLSKTPTITVSPPDSDIRHWRGSKISFFHPNFVYGEDWMEKQALYRPQTNFLRVFCGSFLLATITLWILFAE